MPRYTHSPCGSSCRGQIRIKHLQFFLLIDTLSFSQKAKAAHNPEKTPFEEAFPEAYRELANILGERMSTEREELAAHGKETSGYATPEWPQVVVWPLTTEEVSAIVKVESRG